MTHKDTHNSVDSLLKIMQALRSSDGCPWDRQQTPESLTPYILEEACELIDAIEQGSPEHILDELGDLLLQVVFQAQIFKEKNQFDFNDVAAGITDKMLRRHPHVFDRNGSETHADDLNKQWDEIKRSEATHNKISMADHLPRNLPALQRAQKLIARTYRVNRQTELFKVHQKLTQTMSHPGDSNESSQLDEEALGQALFQLVILAHDARLDAETALRKITQKTVNHLDSE